MQKTHPDYVNSLKPYTHQTPIAFACDSGRGKLLTWLIKRGARDGSESGATLAARFKNTHKQVNTHNTQHNIYTAWHRKLLAGLI